MLGEAGVDALVEADVLGEAAMDGTDLGTSDGEAVPDEAPPEQPLSRITTAATGMALRMEHLQIDTLGDAVRRTTPKTSHGLGTYALKGAADEADLRLQRDAEVLVDARLDLAGKLKDVGGCRATRVRQRKGVLGRDPGT